jgi:hypothetical protein
MSDTDLQAVLARLRRLEDAELARNLLHAYAAVLDDPTPEPVADLFAEDGVLTVPAGTFSGRGEIAAFYRSRFDPATGTKRHFHVNVRTRHVQDGLVEVASYFVFTGRPADASTIGWGQYVDLVRVVDGDARFVHKTITPDVNTDLASGWAADA